MEVASPNLVNARSVATRFLAISQNIISKVSEKAIEAKKLGQDDPRRVIHSLKVAVTITLVSLFYYIKPLFNGFGVSAMWAVLTVILIFEFSVGATLGKGLNRMCATLLGGALGLGVDSIARHSGQTIDPILIAVIVFIVAAMVTFVRFFPEMKARYDYGLLIFMLTFCLISVSGYREEELLRMALARLVTIIIGSSACVIVCILICPVWIGEDLHNQVATNLENLANFLEGFGGECSKVSEDGRGQSNNDKSFLEGYKCVLTSRTTEETMANLARWEPRHGQFKSRHPWEQYLTIGTKARECANKIDALNNCLSSDKQIPAEIQSKIHESTCTMISSETGKALKVLASGIKTMTKPSAVNSHIANSRVAAAKLKSLFRVCFWEGTEHLDMLPAAAVVSLLLDVITCTEEIAQSVNDLASLARYMDPNSNIAPERPTLLQQGTVQPVLENGNLRVITIGVLIT